MPGRLLAVRACVFLLEGECGRCCVYVRLFCGRQTLYADDWVNDGWVAAGCASVIVAVCVVCVCVCVRLCATGTKMVAG